MQQEQATAGIDSEDTGIEQAAELLRLSIPLMSRRHVPPTPENYAVWYHYAAGDKPDLNAEVDRLIREQRTFTAEINTQLYRQFVAEHDITRVDRVRAELQQILSEVGLALSTAGDNAGSFEGTLGGFVDLVSTKNDLRDIRSMLEGMLDSTRSMQSATKDMKTDFESKSHEIEELREQLERERQRAITDPLTGLYNRFALIERLEAALAAEEEDARPSLIMLDIDHFKGVNDKHGHLVGDRVIRFVAQTVLSNIKGKDSAARYGGEEFTVLLPATTSAGAAAVAENIRTAVARAKLFKADNKEPLGQITLSAGVATHRHGEHIMDLINRADRALYRAKNEGRNRVCID